MPHMKTRISIIQKHEESPSSSLHTFSCSGSSGTFLREKQTESWWGLSNHFPAGRVEPKKTPSEFICWAHPAGQPSPSESSAQGSSSEIPAAHGAGRTRPEDPSHVSSRVVVPVTALCHHGNFHQEVTMHPNELRAKLTYCMSPVRNDCSEVIFCTNM